MAVVQLPAEKDVAAGVEEKGVDAVAAPPRYPWANPQEPAVDAAVAVRKPVDAAAAVAVAVETSQLCHQRLPGKSPRTPSRCSKLPGTSHLSERTSASMQR